MVGFFVPIALRSPVVYTEQHRMVDTIGNILYQGSNLILKSEFLWIWLPSLLVVVASTLIRAVVGKP